MDGKTGTRTRYIPILAAAIVLLSMAALCEGVNSAVRGLAQRYGLQVIDLEKWSETALQPRDLYFFDSVHLHEEGQVLIGEYMAHELVPVLSEDPSLRDRRVGR
jgi:lysophospholipase L1-like esterase